MKKLAYKINQYLLEKYPIIWNTKLLWMLSVSLILHILFFILGFTSLTNPKILQEYNAESIFFENGTIFISIIISALLLVIWLIYFFKNNAFKSFYPTNRAKIFKQYLCILTIVFSSTTFFISHSIGLKSYICKTYPKESIDKEINASNTAAIFFSNAIETYTINKKRYPKPFSSLYCETYLGSERDSVSFSKFQKDTVSPYLKFLDYKYRFYTLKQKETSLKDDIYNDEHIGAVFHKTLDSTRVYYYKDSIIDVSKYVKNSKPSYYNYSQIYYLSEENKIIDNINYDNYNEKFNNNNTIWNKHAHDILTRNNEKEIQKILSEFLEVCDRYEVAYNINPDKWFQLIYHPDNFELKSLIRSEPKSTLMYAPETPESALTNFYEEHITDYYIKKSALHNVFENIEAIKASTTHLESIHFFLWFSFFIAALIFMFKISGLKPLLFSIISSGILIILISLLTVSYSYISGLSNNSETYFISYLTLILASIIFSVPIFFSKKIKKLIVAICLNISIMGFILYILLIITTISMHQSDSCKNSYSLNLFNEDCFTLINSLGIYWSYVLFFLNLIFIYLYSKVIKNWTSLPEA